MNETTRRFSRTAVLVAAARALHREGPPPWLLDDTLGLALAGEEGAAIKERMRAELPAPTLLAFSRGVCARAHLSEDLAERELAQGVQQYVILGAGLDTFAYRRADLLERLRVFEVDQPATQVWKRQRLAEIGIEPPANLVFAPVDFERQSLRAGLVAAGFESVAPAVFSWMGVTMYLTLDAIRATLTTVLACAPGSRIALTYNRPLAALQGSRQNNESALQRLVADLGEPMISLFEPAEIEEFLRDLGFANVEHFGAEEASQRIIIATVGG